MKHKFKLLGKSFSISTIIILIAAYGFMFTGGKDGSGVWNRLFILLGGDFISGGYIQHLTYIAFFWSLFDILKKRKIILIEMSGLTLRVLPTEEKHLLIPSEVANLSHLIREHEKKNKLLVLELIKKACVKFRSTKSISEMLEIISIQTQINQDKAESDQSNIRYLTWVIPSIGFIGTVIGISQALMIANDGDMKKITATLGVAFDTTLIALVLSIIIMWFFHNLQEETDRLHAEIKDYVITNLVNRIEM